MPAHSNWPGRKHQGSLGTRSLGALSMVGTSSPHYNPLQLTLDYNPSIIFTLLFCVFSLRWGKKEWGCIFFCHVLHHHWSACQLCLQDPGFYSAQKQRGKPSNGDRPHMWVAFNISTCLFSCICTAISVWINVTVVLQWICPRWLDSMLWTLPTTAPYWTGPA